MRIVSLLPSATEIVCALGLADQLVGVTHECDFPEAAIEKRKVTRTHIPTNVSGAEIDRLVKEQRAGQRALYSLDFDALLETQPDLLISQTLCDVCAVSDAEVCEALRRLPSSTRVVNLEPTRLHDVLGNFQDVGRAAGAALQADRLVRRLRRRIDDIRDCVAADTCGWDWLTQRPRVLVLEWLNPLFSCGHWTPDLVELAGGVEPVARAGSRSRELAEADVAAADPHVIMIACCGWTVERAWDEAHEFLTRPAIRQLNCVREGRVYLTDGASYFSRPGPRLVDSLEVLAHAIWPEVVPPPEDAPAATRIASSDMVEAA